MFDPSSITLGQVSSSVRDFAIVGTLLTASWKARGAYEAVTQFFTRTMKHMDAMEAGMNTLLTNHLAHMEQDLKTMAHHQVRASAREQDGYVVDDAPPTTGF
jgi:hypothetical protein